MDGLGGLREMEEIQEFCETAVAHVMARPNVDMLYTYVYFRNLSKELVIAMNRNLTRCINNNAIPPCMHALWTNALLWMRRILNKLLEVVYDARSTLVGGHKLMLKDIQSDMQLNKDMLNLDMRIRNALLNVDY